MLKHLHHNIDQMIALILWSLVAYGVNADMNCLVTPRYRRQEIEISCIPCNGNITGGFQNDTTMFNLTLNADQQFDSCVCTLDMLSYTGNACGGQFVLTVTPIQSSSSSGSSSSSSGYSSSSSGSSSSSIDAPLNAIIVPSNTTKPSSNSTDIETPPPTKTPITETPSPTETLSPTNDDNSIISGCFKTRLLYQWISATVVIFILLDM